SPFSHVTILTAHRHGHCISFATHTATPNIYPLSLHDALPISVTQRVDPLDPVAADLGAEEIPLEVEGGGREVGVLEPRAGLEDRSEEHTSELQSRENLVCRLLLEKKKKKK